MPKIPNFTSEELRFWKATAFGAAGVCLAVLLVLAQLPPSVDEIPFWFAACGFTIALPFNVAAGLVLHPIDENKTYATAVHRVLLVCGSLIVIGTSMGILGVVWLVNGYLIWIYLGAASTAAALMMYGRRRVTNPTPGPGSASRLIPTE